MTRADVKRRSNIETMAMDELEKHIDRQIDCCCALESKLDGGERVADRWFFAESLDEEIPLEDSFSLEQQFARSARHRNLFRFNCRLWFNVDLTEWVCIDAAAAFRRMSEYLLQQAAKCDELAANEKASYLRRAAKVGTAEKVPA